ncbi:hypothetical protein Poly24_19680 [Rosistilla carotiformis]|uniref:Uncharacterized protein n=2 Tax=Rosistilla carotiformis TaxID=2528017 RepID=A0A518JRS5_9BACT|nr:hypothetical protein Poly24_19680 [Rosistilla carotiformis]
MTPHEVYEIIPPWLFWSALVASLGIAYPMLMSIQHRSTNQCTHCDARNNGRYFAKKRHKRPSDSQNSETHRRTKRRRRRVVSSES